MPPRIRPDLDRIQPYRPGRSITEVAATYSLDDVVKLASNESAEPPWPEVQQAIAAAVGEANRYPDNSRPEITAALADHVGVAPEAIWCGGASNELTFITALCMGGPGTSSVYGWPSFSLYRIGSRAAFTDDFAVPLTADHRHDLDAMARAIRSDTTMVYVCNPNNPTSTHVSGASLRGFIDSLPETTLVLVDEAYAEYAVADDFESMIPLAASRPNVMVTRTFSKVYGLAGLRIGYAVTSPSTIDQFRRVQLPFSVSRIAEVAAVEALAHQDRVAARVQATRVEIERLTAFLVGMDIEVAASQANFVYASFGEAAPSIVEALLRRGLIVRPVAPEGFLRITAGTPDQNDLLMEALEEARST
jgi:histidinol-phosphate aminotransferase